MSDSNEKSSLWRIQDYRWWFVGDSSAAFGGGLRNFATPLLAIAVTGSAAKAGLITSLASVAMAVGIFYGGLLADKVHKRIAILATCSAAAMSFLAVGLLSITVTG